MVNLTRDPVELRRGAEAPPHRWATQRLGMRREAEPMAGACRVVLPPCLCYSSPACLGGMGPFSSSLNPPQFPGHPPQDPAGFTQDDEARQGHDRSEGWKCGSGRGDQQEVVGGQGAEYWREAVMMGILVARHKGHLPCALAIVDAASPHRLARVREEPRPGWVRWRGDAAWVGLCAGGSRGWGWVTGSEAEARPYPLSAAAVLRWQ